MSEKSSALNCQSAKLKTSHKETELELLKSFLGLCTSLGIFGHKPDVGNPRMS